MNTVPQILDLYNRVLQQQCQFKSYLDLQVFVFAWQLFWCPACASTDVAGSELAQGHIRKQSVRLMLILLIILQWVKQDKRLEYAQRRRISSTQVTLTVWQLQRHCWGMFVCCKWIVIVRSFEEEIFNLTLLPSTLYCGNVALGWF